MSFVVSVHPSRCAPVVDVRVEPDAATTVGDLRVALADLLGVDVPALCVGAEPVADSLHVGHPPLVHGCEILVTDGRSGPPTSPNRGRSTDGTGPVALHVVAGPDAGARGPVHEGTTIGRAAGCHLTLDDPGLSREHATARLTPDGVVVTDLDSTNGITLTRGASGTDDRAGHVLRPGDVIRLAATRLALGGSGAPPGRLAPDGLGRLVFTSHEHPRQGVPEQALRRPQPPTPEPRGRMPWLAALLPVPVAAALALALGPMMLWFAALSPVTMLGTAWGERIASRRRAAAADREHAADVAAFASACAHRLRVESEALEGVVPDPAALLEGAERRTSILWSVTAGSSAFGTVRLGWGRPMSRVTVRDGAAGSAATTLVHEDAPVLHDVLTASLTAVTGPTDRVARVLRLLVGQLVVTHPPSALRVIAVGLDEDWRWAPHVVVATTADGVREALAHRSDPERHDCLVAIGPGASEPLAASARACGERMGAAVLLGRTDATPLSEAVTIALGADTALLVRPGEPDVPLAADGVGAWWCTRLARSLAPLRETGNGGGTDPIHLTDLVGWHPHWHVRPDCPDRPARSDRAADAQPDGTRPDRARPAVATLGLADGRPWRVDLDRDGPHLLVGGTTGSGKSELLRVLITSLALDLPPHEISFVLVDYKGGASFGACADLPHTVGLLTDLDPMLVDRALTSLRAEVTRRERLLADHGVADRAAFLTAAGSDRERARMPRLVIVIDEFRALAQEQPEVLAGLVHIAAVGRSLGIHLVLATQRPGGVVSPEIRANVNLRIALRMRDRHDSIDVIDSPDAAHLPAAAPGRALARLGDGELVPFQVLPISTPVPTVRSGLNATIVRTADGVSDGVGGASPATGGGSPGATTGLDVAVATMRSVCREAGVPLPHPVWQPPLPHVLANDGLPDNLVGLVDLPTQQRRDELSITPGAGHWLVVGGPGSGRTTTLLTIIEALIAHHSPDDVHVHVLEAGHALRDRLTTSPSRPHLGTVTGADEPRRAGLLLRRLIEVDPTGGGQPAVGDGQPRDGGGQPRDGGGQPTTGDGQPRDGDDQPRAGGGIPGVKGSHPRIVLVVDGADRLDGTDPFAPHPLGDALTSLLDRAGETGVTLVLSTGRAGLIGRWAEQATTTLLLPVHDAADLALAGVRRSAVPHEWRPGRALRLSDNAQIQIVLPGGRGPASGSSDSAAGTGDSGTTSRAFVVEDLPLRVSVSELPPSTRGELALGVHGDPVRPLFWSPSSHGRTLLVSGPARSGRSSSLSRIAAAALEGARTVVWLACGRPPAPGLVPGGITVLGPDDAAQLVEARRAHPDLTVLVDDAHLLLDTPAQAPILEIAGRLDRDDGILAVTVDPGPASGQYRGLVPLVASAGHALLLGSRGNVEGGLLGLHSVETVGSPPGRALLLRDGVRDEVHLAMGGPGPRICDARSGNAGSGDPSSSGSPLRAVSSALS